MVSLLFGILEQGLKLWNTKEAKEYLEKLINLKKDWYAEYNKGAGKRSNAVLDNIERELCIIGEAFSSSAAPKNNGN